MRRSRLAITVFLVASALFAWASFSLPTPVLAVATITLTPNAGGAGTTVIVTGTGFGSLDTTCTISSSGPATLIASSTCTITGGTGTIASASFVVTSSPTPGSYSITVTGTQQADVSNPASFSVPSVTVSPFDGPAGTMISITGSGFDTVPGSTTCSLSSATAGLVTSPTACTFTGTSITGAATFIIGAGVAAGTYTVILLTQSNVRVTFTVIVRATPKIALNPSFGPPSQIVTVSQSSGQFSSADTSCTITGAGVVVSPSCIILAGVLQSTSQFQVSGAAVVGPHTVTVTGTS